MASPPAKMGKRCQGFYAGFNSRRIFRFNFGIGRFSLRVRDRVDHFGTTCTFVTSGDPSSLCKLRRGTALVATFQTGSGWRPRQPRWAKGCQGFYAGFNSRRIFRMNEPPCGFSLRVRDRGDHFGTSCTFVTSGDASRYLLKRVADGVPASQDERKVPRFLRWI